MTISNIFQYLLTVLFSETVTPFFPPMQGGVIDCAIISPDGKCALEE